MEEVQMKNLLLMDGNSMLFRAYYATLYSGKGMRTSQGIPTNAVYGFISMVNKAFELIQPDAVFVAWDSGKPTFRHEQFKDYKGTRKELDQDLIVQFPIAREYLDAYGICRYECDGIEADDIIGSIAKAYPDTKVHILSSDRDLLQLIDATTDVYLMKKGLTEIEVMNLEKLKETLGIVPSQIIDLKALMGDTADNIPGVAGIGEKTALKLLSQYETVDRVYECLEEQKGKLKEKLTIGKEQAFLSKYLATIKTDASIPISLEEMKYQKKEEDLHAFYVKYEMNRFASQSSVKKEEIIKKEFVRASKCKIDALPDPVCIYFDYDEEYYLDASLHGVAICLKDQVLYMNIDDFKKDEALLTALNQKQLCTTNVKMVYHMLKKESIALHDFAFDMEIGAFLLDGSLTDYEKVLEKYECTSTLKKEDVYGKKGRPKLVDEEEQFKFACEMAQFLSEHVSQVKEELKEKEMLELFETIEMPLAKVLFELEENGVCCDVEVLNEIAATTKAKIDAISEEIYAMAEHEFNINSPKQLAVVLFDELGLKSGKKRSTAQDVLEKLVHVHPMIPLLLKHRKYSKIYSTYATGLAKHIANDGKIHTIFNQTQTQTGRLSSSEPNLQNISVKDEEAKEIRKAFVASEGCVLLSADYSQIELRMLAHMADEKQMIDAYQHDIDIHTKTAAQIYDVPLDEVDPSMRRNAKTVNFGIVYGQSDFGLSSQLGISRKEAAAFIEKYFASYPKIKTFMEETIAFCEEHGYVKTLFGRRRYIKEIHDKNYMMREFGKRAAMNAPIQGSAADLIKVAMLKIAQVMKEKQVKSKMILQIHDELIFDVEKDEIEQMKQIVEEGMQQAMQLKVPLIAQASIGASWFDAK